MLQDTAKLFQQAEKSFSKMPAHEQSLSSLQEIFKGTKLEGVRNRDDIGSKFPSLAPKEQRTIVEKLCEKLTDVEHDLEELQNIIPPTDYRTFLYDGRLDAESEKKRDGFCDHWASVVKPSLEEIPARDTIWNSYHLFAASPDSPFTIVRPNGIDYPTYKSTFGARITSQLLLYRLLATFDNLNPGENDGFKSCWQVCLQMTVESSNEGILRLADSKGAVTIHFEGTDRASKDAVDLLNYLVSTECVHPYDRLVAGQIA